MERTAVQSSNVAEIGYESNSMILEVQFNKGEIYQYLDVPESTFIEFLHSDSKGRFLNLHIKPNFRFIRL